MVFDAVLKGVSKSWGRCLTTKISSNNTPNLAAESTEGTRVVFLLNMNFICAELVLLV